VPLVRKISAVAQRPGLPKQRSAQPLSWPENQPLISIGITCRKDVYPYGDVRTMEQFLESVGREHPVIVELVRIGTIVDTNYYRSYMWEVSVDQRQMITIF